MLKMIQVFGISSFLVFILVICVSCRPFAQAACEIEVKTVCGEEDCNCRSSFSMRSLFTSIMTLNFDTTVCDKCPKLCTSTKIVSCTNGKCGDKKCICNKCFSGDLCNKPENVHAPKFKQHKYVIRVKESTAVGTTFLHVEATDQDSIFCSDENKCLCAKVTFSIAAGNEAGLFEVNPDTGHLTVQRRLTSKSGEYSLDVLALNAGTDSNLHDATKVVIMVEPDLEHTRSRRDSEAVVEHHVSRRSVLEVPNISGVLLVSFVSDTGNQTVFDIGDSISFNMTVYLNSSYSGSNPTSISISVESEFLTADINSLTKTTSDGGGTLGQTDSGNGKFVVTLDELTPTRTLLLIFSATVNSVGIHPLASLYMKTSITGTSDSAFTHGPFASVPILYSAYPKATLERNVYSDISVFDEASYTMTVYIPKMTFPLIVEVSTAVNTFLFMTVSNFKEVSKSKVTTTASPSITYHSASTGVTEFHRAVSDFGDVTGVDSDLMQNKLVLQFNVTFGDHLELKNYSKHWVGVGMRSNYSMLWVGQEAVYVIKEIPTIKAVLTPVNDTKYYKYYAGDLVNLVWMVNHTDTSYANAESVMFDFYTDSLIIKEFTHTAGSYSKINDTYVTFDFGGNLDLGNEVSGTAVLEVAKTGVMPLMDMNVFVNLKFKSGGKDMETRVFTPENPFTYGVPAFSLNNAIPDQDGNITIGQYKTYKLDILFRRMLSSLIIEVVVPLNQSAIMAIAELRLTHSGSNNVGLNTLAQPQFISSVNDMGIPDRATIDFGVVTNMQTADLTTGSNNMISIEFKIVLNDLINVTDRESLWVGIGVKCGNRMMWLGQRKLKYLEKFPRRPLISAYLNTSDISNLQRGDTVDIETSFFHDNTSAAYASNLKILFMMPPYVVLTTAVTKPDSLTYKQTLTGPLIEVPSDFRFLETFIIKFSVKMDPNNIMPIGNISATCPIQMTYSRTGTSEQFASPYVKIPLKYTVPGVQPSKPTVSPPSQPVAEFYSRGMLVEKSTGRVFACSLSSGTHTRSCFVSSDKGVTWIGLDAYIASVIGVDPQGKIYGIARNARAYMRLDAHDALATAITQNAWISAKSTIDNSNQEVRIVPPEYTNTGVPETQHSVDNSGGTKWGVNSDGVLHFDGTWQQKVKWNCCNA